MERPDAIQRLSGARFGGALLCLLTLALALPACGESELKIIGWYDEEVTLSATVCSEGLCGAHGTCDDSSGEAICTCEPGYRGAACGQCAAGYVTDGHGGCVDAASTVDEPDAGTDEDQRPDAGGSGAISCADSGLSCGPHGGCSTASGTARCVCDEGYAGTNCQDCAAGYQDQDGDGVCRPTCASAGLSCGLNEICSDADGTARCVCAAGYVLYSGGCVLESTIAEWTFMVFLNGDNDLSGSAAEDLKEMQSLTNATKVNVIVLFDSSGSSDTEVYKITSGGKTKLSTGTSIYSGNEADMGNAETLRKFAVWAIKNYPAKKHALVMWNHGGGWRDGTDNRCGRSAAFKDFSSDDTSGSIITLADGAYGSALKAITDEAGKKIDLIGFDTCLMGMYEVAAVNAPYGDYLVASAESEPAYGWTYDVIMRALGTTPGMDARTLGTAIIDAYYDAGSYNATLALFDLSETDNMTAKLNTFASSLTSALSSSSHKSVIEGVRENTQGYGYSEHADLRHFATQIKNSTSLSSTLRDAAGAVVTQISSFMVYARTQSHSAYWGYSHANASGLAIFFPESFVCCTDTYDCYSVLSPCGSAQQEASGWYSDSEMTVYKSGKGAVWSSNWKTFVRKYSGID